MRGILPSFAVSCAVVAVSAAAAGAPVDKTPSVTGTVARVVSSQRLVEVTLADGTVQRFQWNAETKISGTLTPGAAVTVRYTPGTDGQNLALQITVSRS
jgi:YD repeat-containing protein